jgi:hypothetical protein
MALTHPLIIVIFIPAGLTWFILALWCWFATDFQAFTQEVSQPMKMFSGKFSVNFKLDMLYKT